MPGEPWLILPTYNEAENIEAIVARRRRGARARRARGLPRARRRRRLARRHRARSPTAWPPSTTGSRCCTAPRRTASAPPTSPAFATRSTSGAGLRDGDGLRLLPRPADLARLLGGGPRRRRPRARLALRARRRGQRLGPAAALHQRGRLDLRAPRARPAGARPHRRLQVLSPRGARGDPLRRRALAAATPSRSSSPTARCSAGFRVVEVPIVFRDRQHGQSKMSWRIAAEAMWLVPRLRFR